MNLQKLERRDLRLIAVCVLIAAASLYVGVKYFFLAFPEASIEFRYTRESSTGPATSFLSRMGLAPGGYRHAAVFGFDDQAKTFLEREVGVAEANRLLDSTVRLWRWKHRWFRPLHKEEMDVDVTTKGEVVGFDHLLPEDAAGADLTPDEARVTAEGFLTRVMERPLEELEFVESSMQKRPHRTDHTFTWKVRGSEIQGADYRVEVGVSGADVASYAEYLKVPDSWVRDYAKLRSKNEITGQIDAVLLLLTMLAMLVVLVLRVRRGDVRWKAAAILGGLIFVLLSLSQLNSLPSALYGYDTTDSFGGFLTTAVLRALLAGFGAGVAIFLIAASAEPLYRERFPGRLSLTSILRFRGLRTKEFFIATLVGITLTFFFFAYENVFYIIANSLGAWAPRDVAYSDLLSTSFPWVYVLFFGFLPAISEEFISRMFSIPFFEKFLRSTAAAVVVAAFIWGFGHAGYPNQPFWIRGLEVGLAGIVFGTVLLRFGIVAVVVCHFSVDALYTAFVLIRSPDPYYVVTGCLSAGIFGVLLVGAAVAYFLKGGFLPADRTNAEEGVAPPVAPRAAVAAPPTTVAYGGLSGVRVAWAVALAAALGGASLVRVPHFGDWVAFGATRQGARTSAEEFLAGQDFDVSRYRSVVTPLDRTDPTAAAYLQRFGAAERFYEKLVPTPLWRVRFFVPQQHEEYQVSVETTSGEVVGFNRTLPEDAPGATVEPPEALRIARDFLKAHGVDPAAGELKEQTAKDEKARRDHTLVWEFPEPDAGEARVRQQVVVQGDVVGSWGRIVKIPEEWRREREKTTAVTTVLRWLKFPYLMVLGGLAVVLLIARIRSGEMPWRFALTVGAVSAALALVRGALSLSRFWANYDTSIPAGAYFIVIAIGLFLSAIFLGLAGTVVAGLAGALFPRATRLLSRDGRRTYARDALVAGLPALGLVLGLPAVVRMLERLVPSGRLVDGVSWPGGVASPLPALDSATNALWAAIFVAGLGAIVVGLLRTSLRSTVARVALGALFVVSFLPSDAREPAEYLVAALSVALVGAAVVLLVLWFLRDNPLAWLWSAFFAFGAAAGWRLLEQPAAAYKVHGAALLAAITLVGLWLLRDAVLGARSDRL